MTKAPITWWDIGLPAGRRRRASASSKRGQIKAGSSTEKVLDVLIEALPGSMNRSQIVNKADCPAKSVDWALFYLRSIGRVACWSSLDKRSHLYLQYKAIKKDAANG